MRAILLCLGLLISVGLGYAEEKKPILLVLTNHAVLGSTQEPTGFYLSEAAHPWKVFRDAGYPVVLASPNGGMAPVDPKSLDLDDPVNAEFWKTFGGNLGDLSGVLETQALGILPANDFSGIFFAGGHGTMWDFPNSTALAELTAKIYDAGGVVGAVCHGPAALVAVTLANGSSLVKGKEVAIFTNAEEEAVGLTTVVPFLLQDRLQALGAKPKLAPNFQENAVRDGRLVTGQNPASAHASAILFLEALQP